MSKLNLVLKKSLQKSRLPIEAEAICPDVIAGKTISEIAQLKIWKGNKELSLEAVFNISGDDTFSKDVKSNSISIKGNLWKVKRIGQNMSAGEITIEGDVGMHLGFQMKGGKITVNGNTDDFAGANMKGGEIVINGNAGHYLGGSTRGNWRGMNGGKIKVTGNVGNECCVWMRKGLVEIMGNASMFLGMHMHRGIIVVHGDVTERAGAEMTGGIIIINGKLHRLLPSFEFKQEVKNLEIEGLGKIQGEYLEFHGDFAERKQGKLYLLTKNNSKFKQ